MAEIKQNNNSLEHRLTRLESYIENHNLHERVDALEYWKAVVLGATILTGSLITLFAAEIKNLVI